MEAQVARKTLHELIEQTKDAELLTLCIQLLEREIRNSSTSRDFFNTTVTDLKSRAAASEKAIAEDRIKSFEEFNEGFEQWKIKKRAAMK